MKKTLIIIVLSCVCLALGRWCRCLVKENRALRRYPPLRSIVEVQLLIGCEKIDGKLSPDWRNSETQRKWDEYMAEQYSREVCGSIAAMNELIIRGQ